jgi:hypothetical protein
VRESGEERGVETDYRLFLQWLVVERLPDRLTRCNGGSLVVCERLRRGSGRTGCQRRRTLLESPREAIYDATQLLRRLLEPAHAIERLHEPDECDEDGDPEEEHLLLQGEERSRRPPARGTS